MTTRSGYPWWGCSRRPLCFHASTTSDSGSRPCRLQGNQLIVHVLWWWYASCQRSPRNQQWERTQQEAWLGACPTFQSGTEVA